MMLIKRLTFKQESGFYRLIKSINVLDISIKSLYSLKDLKTFRERGIEVVIK